MAWEIGRRQEQEACSDPKSRTHFWEVNMKRYPDELRIKALIERLHIE